MQLSLERSYLCLIEVHWTDILEELLVVHNLEAPAAGQPRDGHALHPVGIRQLQYLVKLHRELAHRAIVASALFLRCILP